MPYVLGDLSEDWEGGEATHEQVMIYGTGPASPPKGSASLPQLRPWPGPTATATSSAGTGASSAGKVAGTPVGQRFTPSSRKPAACPPGTTRVKDGSGRCVPFSSGKPVSPPVLPFEKPRQTAPETSQPTEPPATEMLPEAPASTTPTAGFFSKYKWWFIGGAAAMVAGGAYLILKEPT